MSQVRSCLQWSIFSGIVESRQRRRVISLSVGQKILPRRIFVMQESERAIVPRFDGNLSDAAQTRRQPLCERDLLRRPAHFRAREMR